MSVVIFPEGTRSRTGEMGPFKVGAFKLAVEEGVSIVPITINGTFAIAGRPVDKTAGGALIRADEMSMNLGEVSVTVHPELTSEGQSINSLMVQTRQVIQAAMDVPQCSVISKTLTFQEFKIKHKSIKMKFFYFLF